MRKEPFIVMTLTLLAIAIAPAAQASLVTCRTGSGCLNGNDSYDWTTNFGPPFTPINNGSVATSNGGVTAIVTFVVGGPGERRDEGNGWLGNFFPGDELLTTNNSPGQGPLNFSAFNTTIFGIGAQIDPGPVGAFTAQICDSNMMCVTENGFGNTNGDGSAIFIGLTDSAGFFAATFSLTSCAYDCANFAINQMDIVTTGTAIPEPGSMLLLSSGLLGAIAYRRRRLGL